MKHSKNFLAFDLGASNGRGFVGKFDGEKLSIFELLRFEHTIISDTSRLCWDYEKIQQNIEKTFYLAAKNQIPLDSFGIDAWCVDYSLLNGASSCSHFRKRAFFENRAGCKPRRHFVPAISHEFGTT